MRRRGRPAGARHRSRSAQGPAGARAIRRSRLAWTAEVGHSDDRLGGRIVSICPALQAASGEHPALWTRGEGGCIGAPVVHGDTGGGELTRIDRPLLAVLALDRLAHHGAELARQLGEAELEAWGYAHLTV